MTSKIGRSIYFVSCATATLLAAPACFAQTVDAPPAVEQTGLDEIIVTAQRRGENVQDVPIAINVLNADQLAAMGGTSSEDLTMLVPSVVYNPSAGGGGITIRGIGGTNSGTDEPGNAIYVDGVYQYAPTSNLFGFNAIDRIEILKGPQGTLFGRNTAGGVINIITRDPGSEASGEAEIGFSNYDTTHGNIYLSAPITENLGVNFAAFGTEQNEGWGVNVPTGTDAHIGHSWGARGKLQWTSAGGGSDVMLALTYNEDRPVGAAAGNIAAGTLDALGNPSTGLYNTNSEFDNYRESTQRTAALTIRQDLGFARLTSITAQDNVEAVAVLDADGTPGPIFPFGNLAANLSNNYETFTQEFHLQSNEDSQISWILGTLYLDNESPGRFVLSPIFDLPSLQTTVSKAVFGQATVPLSEATDLTLGLRYTMDERRLISPVVGIDRTAEDNELSWRLALDHQFSGNTLGYVSYSRGFKSGVFNGTSPLFDPAEPTTLDAYEVGLKWQTDDHRIRINTAVFFYQYDGVQVELFDIGTGGAYIANAGTAESYGLDLDIAYEPIDNLVLTAGVGLLSAEFTSQTLAPCFTVPAPPTGGLVRADCPLDGSTLPFSPEAVVSLGASYGHETSVGRFDFSAAYSYNSGYYPDPSNFEPTHVDAFNLVNASVRWAPPSSPATLTLWGKNLLDEEVSAHASLGAGLTGSVVYPQAPLTYGLTLGFTF